MKWSLIVFSRTAELITWCGFVVRITSSKDADSFVTRVGFEIICDRFSMVQRSFKTWDSGLLDNKSQLRSPIMIMSLPYKRASIIEGVKYSSKQVISQSGGQYTTQSKNDFNFIC